MYISSYDPLKCLIACAPYSNDLLVREKFFFVSIFTNTCVTYLPPDDEPNLAIKM